MHVLLFLVEAFLVRFGAVDALWTTLWVDGNAGPMMRELDIVARKLNTRARETLAWHTPAEVFEATVAATD